MSLAEGVSADIRYKFYSSGTMTANALAVSGTDLVATGGQLLRRVSSTLALQKNTYQSQEIRSDRQIVDFRHGTQTVQGNISGELSALTYFDLFEAVHRDTRAAGVSLSHTDFTSMTASASGSSITFGSGNPVTSGLKVGQIIRFTGITSTPGNNNKNFVIEAFGGTTNETLTVSPAPADQSSDTAFSLTSVGKSTIVPATGHVARKAAFEVYHADLDVSRLYTECRLGSYRLNLPATGMATTEFSVMGRAQEDYSAGSAPFLSAPADPTGTGVMAAVNGSLYLGGSKVGVVTSVEFTHNLQPSAADVVGQNFPAEIFLGRANITGQIGAYLDSNLLIDDFINESELQLLLYLTATNAANSPALTVLLPRIKLSSASVGLQGESGQMITAGFQALRYVAGGAGIPSTTIQICDTEVT